jgi:hypothetical protein
VVVKGRATEPSTVTAAAAAAAPPSSSSSSSSSGEDDNNDDDSDDDDVDDDITPSMYGANESHNNCTSSDGGDYDPDDLDYELSDQSVTASEAESPNPMPLRRRCQQQQQRLRGTRATVPTRAELRADLWLAGSSTAVDVVVAASCRLGRARAFDRAAYKKYSKYQPAVDDGTIAVIVPFVMSPFGVLAKPAKAFVKRAMGFVDASKVAKARLRLAVAAARGTARLAHAWNACSVLIVGDF